MASFGRRMEPFVPPSGGGGKMPGRMLAICGRWTRHRISASTFPPSAGRVCSKSPSAVCPRAVQSAVRPVPNRAATQAERKRLRTVAGKSALSASRPRSASATRSACAQSSSSNPTSTASLAPAAKQRGQDSSASHSATTRPEKARAPAINAYPCGYARSQ